MNRASEHRARYYKEPHHAVLLKTRDLLIRPERWTKGALARDAQGVPCNVHDESARSFDLFGAIYRVSGNSSQALDISELMARKVNRVYASEWNDDPRTTHAKLIQEIEELRVGLMPQRARKKKR